MSADAGIGHLTMLKLAGDDFVTLGSSTTRLRAGPTATHPSATSSSRSTTSRPPARGYARGMDVDETRPDGAPDFWTRMLADPDGNRIELVKWPPATPTACTTATSTLTPRARTHRRARTERGIAATYRPRRWSRRGPRSALRAPVGSAGADVLGDPP